MTTLTDRYVAAAARAVPDAARADLRAELRASIADAVEARIDAGEEPEAAERAILTGLGDPERLAAEYADRPLVLIGPRFYLVWRRLLTTLLAIVPAIVVGAVILAGLLASDGFGEIVGAAVQAALLVITGIAFWTTLVFALIERYVRDPLDEEVPWSPDRLPEIKPTQSGISDLVASLSVIALTTVAVLWDHLRGFVHVDGVAIPILDPDLWPWWVAGLFVVLAAEAIVAIAVFRRGCWTVRLAAVNTLVTLAFGVPALWLLSRDRLLNPAFLADAVTPLSSELADLLPAFVAIGIVIATALEIVDACVKAVRVRRSTP